MERCLCIRNASFMRYGLAGNIVGAGEGAGVRGRGRGQGLGAGVGLVVYSSSFLLFPLALNLTAHSNLPGNLSLLTITKT